jgi:type II secretion system protein D
MQGQQQDAKARTVRMNFFNATWPHVLRKVAERSGSELVMDRAPAGRFTRTDMHKYTRSEAVRMLNEEMEPKGFRLLEQGNHLVVLHLDELRSRYSAARLPYLANSAPTEAMPLPTAANPVPTYQQDPLVQPTEYRGDASVTRPPAFQAPVAGAPVTGSSVTGSSVASAPQELPRGGAVRPAATRPLVVDARNRGAKEVARVIYNALRSRAELIDSGPANLPAFRVFANDQSRPIEQAEPAGRRVGTVSTDVQFTVGIDSNREQLVIDAAPEQQRGVAQLIRHIDAAGTSSGQVIRLIDMAVDATRVAEHLGPALQMMVRQQLASTESDADEPAAAKVHVLTNQPQPTTTADDPAAEGGDDEPLVQLEGLRGPVTIQDVPGVGMVVTGNQTDVDAVVKIIRELERMSAGAEADVQLLMLRHVNSAALAELMNNVYEELTAIRSVGASQQPLARIVAVVRPNAVLIIAGVGDLEAILDLAEKLDQPTDPRNEIEVFALSSAVAADVVRTIESMYEPTGEGEQASGLRLRVKAVADARTNTVIVQAAPSDLNEIGLLIRRIDRDVSSSVSRMKVFTLKNAVADELADVINGALASILSPAGSTSSQTGGGGPGGGGPGGGGPGGGGSGQDTQQLLAVKSVVLELLTGGDAAGDTVRSGILADIRVTADVRVNSLIVTAPEQSMPLMAALISQLDAPSTNVAEIKVFALKNSDASSTMELLETLFTEGDDENPSGVQIVGAEDASSGLIPIRFSIDVRTNSVIAIGGAEALRVVEAVILRLDQSDVRQRKSEVVPLKNTSAELVAQSINEFLESQRDLATIDPELVSNVELLEQEIIVVAEPISNSLLVSTTERYRDDIINMVKILDEAPEQVVIQVLIVEVLLENTDEFGVELGFQDSVLFNRSLINPENFQTIDVSTSNPGTGVVTTTQQIVSQEGVPGFLFNNNQIGNNLSPSANPSKVGSQGLSSFSLGRINGDLGFGGLVMSASSEAVSVLIRALSAKRDVQVLSRPQIRTVDNQLAEIFVGQQVPVITATNINPLGGISPVIGAPQQVGIILQVTPRITPDGVIVMETIANKSAISGQGVPLLTDPATGAVVESQIFDVTEAHATVAVPDGQTIVLGGMITKAEDTLERKVPWLGDIPILGAAFRYDGTSTRRTELLIFMTPRIVKNSLDSEMIKQVEIERMHFLECDAEEIHGPLYSAPPATPARDQDDAEELPSDDSFYPSLPDDEDDVPTTVMPKLRSPSAVHYPGTAGGVVTASLNQPTFANNAQPAAYAQSVNNAEPVTSIRPQPLPGVAPPVPGHLAPARLPATPVPTVPQTRPVPQTYFGQGPPPYVGPQVSPQQAPARLPSN